VRVVVDSQLRMPTEAKMLSLPGQTIVATVNGDEDKIRQLQKRGAEVLLVEQNAGRVDLPALLLRLGEKQINEIMVEAGPTLNGELLHQKLVDELIVYMAPIIMGDAAKGLFTLPGLERMQDRINLSINDIRAVGRDWRISVVVRD
jgi:diaminohydroxyphosphoribosylaminopyrimidine deaminase/5-amino-6-(5-phosphoribosylamino)uracil reductase